MNIKLMIYCRELAAGGIRLVIVNSKAKGIGYKAIIKRGFAGMRKRQKSGGRWIIYTVAVRK
jgi:hypothetical protein